MYGMELANTPRDEGGKYACNTGHYTDETT
jgi:hypothetical protein